jgi:UDP-N-acetylmuramate dehydrogenase
MAEARQEGVPLFILGGGANILVSDRGVRGIVLDTGGLCGIAHEGGGVLCCGAGVPSDEVSDAALRCGLGGAEFLAGLPGTIGGAVLMNARCWEREVAGILLSTEVIDVNLGLKKIPFNSDDFGYKKSPFQGGSALILGVKLQLTEEHPQNINLIAQTMDDYRTRRREKGHFRFPCAGSVFKNNRAFGKPSGRIIEELGLKGTAIGGARIADWHGNIIINTGGATSTGIRALVTLVQEKALAELGVELETEIVFVGEF